MIDINLNEEFIEFKDYDAKLLKLKEWKLISPKAQKITKPLLYKGIYVDSPTEYSVIGYITKYTNDKCLNMTYETAVIKVNGKIIKISPAYLKEMKSSKFKICEPTD